jgi:hypothetical protein
VLAASAQRQCSCLLRRKTREEGACADNRELVSLH